MRNLWTVVAAIAAASAAGIITEWSASKEQDAVQIVAKSPQTACVPQMTTVPHQLHMNYLRFRPEQRI